MSSGWLRHSSLPDAGGGDRISKKLHTALVRAFPEYIDYCPALLENGCLRVIRGSHRDRSLRRHHTVQAGDVTPTQALDASEFDETNAVDLVLKAGQISLHDVFLLHGSEPNLSSKPRRGMTMRFMPTTSLFDRELAKRKAIDMNIVDHSNRPVFLMSGEDRHGRNQLIKL
ncbi:MAG: hypothetical protein EBV84_07785 [Betaproteobacteria bacterium]|nr:hypothetical protein [Betaproteobacteria bacterium]